MRFSTAHRHCRSSYNKRVFHQLLFPLIFANFGIPSMGGFPNLPGNIESAVRSIVRQLIPGSDAEIDIALPTARTRIFHRDNHCVPLPANTIIAPCIRRFDFSPAEWPRGFVEHPVVADGGDDGRVGVFLAAGTGAALLCVDCAAAGVPVVY